MVRLQAWLCFVNVPSGSCCSKVSLMGRSIGGIPAATSATSVPAVDGSPRRRHSVLHCTAASLLICLLPCQITAP